MKRVTEKQLQAVVDRINTMTNSPKEPYYVTYSGVFVSSVGNYHLSYAYGGVALHRMVNEVGGVSDVFSRGHMPKRELLELMYAFITGYDAAKEGN
jgi:hypothetical protein